MTVRPWTAHGQLNSPIFWDPNNPAPYECQPAAASTTPQTFFLKSVPAVQLNMGTPFYGYYYTNINQLFGLVRMRLTLQMGNATTPCYGQFMVRT